MADLNLNNITKADAVKIIAAAKAVLEKGTKSGEVRAKPQEIVPTTPEYAHMTKAQFIEAEKKRKEKALKMKAYEKELDEGNGDEIEPEKEVTPSPEKKAVKRGRPKK